MALVSLTSTEAFDLSQLLLNLPADDNGTAGTDANELQFIDAFLSMRQNYFDAKDTTVLEYG